MNTKLAECARRVMAAGAANRFLRRQDGTAAIEFGFVAAPFLALLFAIIETAMVFFSGQVLETAVADASRLIMTGQADKEGYNTQDAFKTEVCKRMKKSYSLFNCENGVYFDVRTFTSFGNVTNPSPVDAQGKIVVTYSPGVPGSIVMVRLFYEWPVVGYLSPLITFNLANVSGGKHLLVATAAFRNEPYK